MDDKYFSIIREDLEIIKADVKDCQHRIIEVEKLDAIQNEQLAEHMRRSDALEKLVLQFDHKHDSDMKEVRNFRWLFLGVTGIITAIAPFVFKYLGGQ